MKTILGLLLFFSLSGISNAQGLSSVEQTSTKLKIQSEDANKIESNVLQMLKGSISDREYKAGINAYDATHEFETYITSLLTLSYVYDAMLDNRDKVIVKKYFDLQCKSTTKMGEFSVITINKALPSIQSTALINELTKMRDASINMLQTLEFCKN